MTLNTQAMILLTFLPLHNYRELLRNLKLINCVCTIFYNVILQSAQKCTTSKNISTEKFQSTLKKVTSATNCFVNMYFL